MTAVRTAHKQAQSPMPHELHNQNTREYQPSCSLRKQEEIENSTMCPSNVAHKCAKTWTEPVYAQSKIAYLLASQKNFKEQVKKLLLQREVNS